MINVSLLKKIYQLGILPYSLFLVYLMTFGFGRKPYTDHIVRLIPIYSTYLFVKQSILWNEYFSLALNIFGNIFLFIPFGFLNWVLPKYQTLQQTLIVFLSGLLLVEAFQYFSKMGVFDIDDILLNSVGVCIGYSIMQKFNK